MDRLICFIDKDGMSGICTHAPNFDGHPIEGDCGTCPFRDQYLGIERESGFTYTNWTGELYPVKSELMVDPDKLEAANEALKRDNVIV